MPVSFGSRVLGSLSFVWVTGLFNCCELRCEAGDASGPRWSAYGPSHAALSRLFSDHRYRGEGVVRELPIVAALLDFEGSDALGNGDFRLCDRAADTIEALYEALKKCRPLMLPTADRALAAEVDAVLAKARGEQGQ